MKYIDLHCDALTAEGVPSARGDTLKEGDCFLQAFAIFLRKGEGGFLRAIEYCDKFDRLCKDEGFRPVYTSSDLRSEGIHALLTLEGGGAIESNLENLKTLYERGVRMMTLTWNYPNEIGFPNLPSEKGSGEMRERTKGLTAFGREAVERMCAMKMIPDVSHGSDKLVEDVSEICRMHSFPFLASHSCSAEVRACSRNLEAEQIRLIADSGGVVGLNFCMDFISDDKSAESQKTALLAHAREIIDVGGEDVLAIGSDFDGTAPNSYLPSPSHMPKLIDDFHETFGFRIAEKIAYKNALRVLKEAL